jgi:hypothetical protein
MQVQFTNLQDQGADALVVDQRQSNNAAASDRADIIRLQAQMTITQQQLVATQQQITDVARVLERAAVAHGADAIMHFGDKPTSVKDATMPDQLVQIIGKTATRKLREAAARGVFGPRGMLYVRRRDTDAQSRRNRRIVSLYRRKRGPWSMQQPEVRVPSVRAPASQHREGRVMVKRSNPHGIGNELQPVRGAAPMSTPGVASLWKSDMITMLYESLKVMPDPDEVLKRIGMVPRCAAQARVR